MYINTQIDVRCSKCNALNLFEDVWTNWQHLRRCKCCGHEKILAGVTTTTFLPSDPPIIYQMPISPAEETF